MAQRKTKVTSEVRQEVEAVCVLRPLTGIHNLGIYQGEQADALALLIELLGHLESHDASHRIASEEIRPRGLNCAQLVDVVSRHTLDRGPGDAPFIQPG